MAASIQLQRHSERGFTLVEVMVALAIVAAALPALVTLVMAQVDGAGHIRDKTYAMWVAENQYTRLSMLNNKNLFPTYKLSEKDSGKLEMMGLQWQWRYETSKEERVPVNGLLRLDMSVALIGVPGAPMTQDLDKIDPLANLTGDLSE